MKIKTIFKDNKTLVKEVWINGRFLYTVTYIKDAEGLCNKMIRVYRNGKVEIQ